MVQKSGVHQLRPLVYQIIYNGFYHHPTGGYVAGLVLHPWFFCGPGNQFTSCGIRISQKTHGEIFSTPEMTSGKSNLNQTTIPWLWVQKLTSGEACSKLRFFRVRKKKRDWFGRVAGWVTFPSPPPTRTFAACWLLLATDFFLDNKKFRIVPCQEIGLSEEGSFPHVFLAKTRSVATSGHCDFLANGKMDRLFWDNPASLRT